MYVTSSTLIEVTVLYSALETRPLCLNAAFPSYKINLQLSEKRSGQGEAF